MLGHGATGQFAIGEFGLGGTINIFGVLAATETKDVFNATGASFTIAIRGILAAIETKDILLAGALAFNPPLTGEIGVIERGAQAGEVGVTVTIVGGAISVQEV